MRVGEGGPRSPDSALGEMRLCSFRLGYVYMLTKIASSALCRVVLQGRNPCNVLNQRIPPSMRGPA